MNEKPAYNMHNPEIADKQYYGGMYGTYGYGGPPSGGFPGGGYPGPVYPQYPVNPYAGYLTYST